MTISQTTIEALESTEVNSVEAMMIHLFNWHTSATKTLDHFEAIPDGTEMSIEGRKITITGDCKDAFLAGLSVGQVLFSKLPFEAREVAGKDDQELASNVTLFPAPKAVQ